MSSRDVNYVENLQGISFWNLILKIAPVRGINTSKIYQIYETLLGCWLHIKSYVLKTKAKPRYEATKTKHQNIPPKKP